MSATSASKSASAIPASFAARLSAGQAWRRARHAAIRNPPDDPAPAKGQVNLLKALKSSVRGVGKSTKSIKGRWARLSHWLAPAAGFRILNRMRGGGKCRRTRAVHRTEPFFVRDVAEIRIAHSPAGSTATRLPAASGKSAREDPTRSTRNPFALRYRRVNGFLSKGRS